ncbi:MAG: hypoxanthine phosphoribosyltransferase [Candidatus Hydrogenedentota bacterium]
MFYDFRDAVAEVIIDKEAIERRIQEMGEQISKEYAGKDLVFVGVLRGAVVFLADLIRKVSIPCEIDFIDVTSYGKDTKTSGIVRILKDISINVENRDVLVIEDVIDTGLTWHYLRENILAKKPASLKMCCLLDKPASRRIDIKPDYVGFVIPDNFVIGYGLDCQDYFRNIPFVGTPSDIAWDLSTEEDSI